MQVELRAAHSDKAFRAAVGIGGAVLCEWIFVPREWVDVAPSCWSKAVQKLSYLHTPVSPDTGLAAAEETRTRCMLGVRGRM